MVADRVLELNYVFLEGLLADNLVSIDIQQLTILTSDVFASIHLFIGVAVTGDNVVCLAILKGL